MSSFSFWTTNSIDIASQEPPEPSPQPFLNFLATVRALDILILPITWDPGRDYVASGATSSVNQAFVDLHTSFAFKRSNRKRTEAQLFDGLLKEVVILNEPAIRSNPNIAQLQGICWDISPVDDIPWPVLVFEKSALGDLERFMDLPSGQATSTFQRISICLDVAQAIAAMHAAKIVHGDVKPNNILIFETGSQQYNARVTDFGYSTRYMKEGDRIMLPISVPWNAPEIDRINRSWSPDEAKKTDMFSFAALCIWLLFEAELSGRNELPQGCRWPSDVPKPRDSQATDAADFIRQHKVSLHTVADALLSADIHLDESTTVIMGSLRRFLKTCLCPESSQRMGSIEEFLAENISQREDHVADLNSDPDWSRNCYSSLGVDNFLMDAEIGYLYEGDYRVRRHISRQIIDAYTQNGSYRLQAAFCYLAGFGVARDETKAEEALRPSGRTSSGILEAMEEAYRKHHKVCDGHKFPSLLTKLAANGVMERTDLTLSTADPSKVANVVELLEREEVDASTFWGPTSFNSSLIRRSLGRLYGLQGRYQDAEALLMRDLEHVLDHLGEGYADWLSLLGLTSDLAFVYLKQGKVESSVTFFEKVLERCRRDYGAQHSYTLQAMGSLSEAYMESEQIDSAISLLSDALQVGKRILGSQHMRVLDFMSKLASSYVRQERLQEAEQLRREVLAAYEETEGKTSHKTIDARGELSFLLRKTGELKEAQKHAFQMVEDSCSVLGESHPVATASLTNLGHVCNLMGEFEVAKQSFTRSLNICQSRDGERHPNTLNNINGLADTHAELGELGRAGELKTKEMEIIRDVRGEEHPDFVNSVSELASLRLAQGQLSEAERLSTQVVETDKKILGENHEDTLGAMHDLGTVLLSQNRHAEASELYQDLLKRLERHLGPHHQWTLRVMSNLATTWALQGRSKEGTDLMTKCLEIHRTTYGASHPDTRASMWNLARMLQGLQRCNEAMD